MKHIGSTHRSPSRWVTPSGALTIGICTALLLAIIGLLGPSPAAQQAESPPTADDLDGGVDDAMDADPLEPPEIVTTVPHDRATDVSVLIEPSVTFDKDLDVAGIPQNALLLRNAAGEPVSGALRVADDRRTLILTPDGRLRRGESYVLDVDAIRAADGSVSEPTTISFTTSVNPPLYSYYLAGGALVGYRSYRMGNQGELLETQRYDAPGADGDWFTPDDEIGERSVFRYRDRVPVLAIHYSDPGGDGEWLTEDDYVDTYETQELENGRPVTHWRFGGPGDDGIWFNADDTAQSYTSVRYLPSGKVDRIRFHDSPGGDGNWRTDDDHIVYDLVYRYDAQGRLQRLESFGTPGNDGEWGTADDFMTTYWAYERTTSGLERVVAVGYPGGDGRWLTNDDDVTGYVDSQYLPDETLNRRVVYTSPGVDGEWFTDSDQVAYYVARTHVGPGLPARTATYTHPGPDLSWFTDDDENAAYTDTDFNLSGDRLARLTAYHPGPDDVWMTADDLLAAQIRFDPTR